MFSAITSVCHLNTIKIQFVIIILHKINITTSHTEDIRGKKKEKRGSEKYNISMSEWKDTVAQGHEVFLQV